MNQKPENIVSKEIVEKEFIPTMGLDYLVEVTDKNGKVIQRIAAPSRSFVRQFYHIMKGQGSQLGVATTDTDGATRYPNKHGENFECYGTGINQGLRVGKGSTAVTISDYKLETPLGEGTGLDEFNHQNILYTLPAVVGSTCSFTLQRVFINNSGATISGIREIGAYIKGALVTQRWYFLGFRDVLPGAVSVPHGGSITVTYTVGVTV